MHAHADVHDEGVEEGSHNAHAELEEGVGGEAKEERAGRVSERGRRGKVRSGAHKVAAE